jgi:hypothetical protein
MVEDLRGSDATAQGDRWSHSAAEVRADACAVAGGYCYFRSSAAFFTISGGVW